MNGILSSTDKAEQDIIERFKIKSQKVPNGNWNILDPLGWTKGFGRRSPAYEEHVRELACLEPGNPGYFDLSETPISLPDVTIVRTREQARKVLERLYHAIDENNPVFHACDTEVMDIDLKRVGPVGNGFVTCLSMYSGPDFDYGEGPGKSLWIDNLDDAFGVLQEFKEWFEDERYLKVWHNYGFDRHCMWNEGIDVKGLGGDTMHMARLMDTSRQKQGKKYSLESLTEDLTGRRKKPMKEIFGENRLRKDGTEGNIVDIPPVEVMQRDPKYRKKWIDYSTYDAQGTWLVRQELEKRLKSMEWLKGMNLFDYYFMHMRYFGEVLTDMERRGVRVDAHDYLASVEKQAREDREHHLHVFREWAYKMIGPHGRAMNPASSAQLSTFLFGGAENSKTKQPTERVRSFKVALEEIPENAVEELLNLGRKSSETDKENDEKDDLDRLQDLKVAQLKELCKERGLKVSGKKAELQERLREHFLAEANGVNTNQDDFKAMSDDELREALISRNVSPDGTRKQLIDRLRQDIEYTNTMVGLHSTHDRHDYVALSKALEMAAKDVGGKIAEYLSELDGKSTLRPKFIDLTVSSIGLKPVKYTKIGAPSATSDVLRTLAGDPFADPPKYGTAFDRIGKEGCEALFSLCAIGSIDTMIANFLTSLQVLADDKSRVHCSLNLNTETGRLSSRKPNLQNQPALEKDKYKIRRAFQSSPGNSLIVADYGQLELRLLASMTNCKAMIEAFKLGGDFHSRTAKDMFDYIQDKLDKGEVLLEWDYADGDPPKPLLKDEFASERRKAKTLNFSIAYGKTAHGLSQDWGVSQAEANKMLEAWYDSRPEVREWQENTKAFAREHGITRTLMGRYRQIPEAQSKRPFESGHGLRASINTPIQGGAADVAMMAMNKINRNEKLQALGWILLLQIHDEVMLEGPEETAEEAFEIVRECMENPWVVGLKETAVPLLVDGSYKFKTWYDAK